MDPRRSGGIPGGFGVRPAGGGQPGRTMPQFADAPGPAVAVEPAGSAQPADPPSGEAAGTGPSPADSLRQSWSAVLDAVQRERKVAWILLRNTTVLSLQDGVLILGFARDGDLKGFNASGHDAVLKRVLSTGFGLNVTVRGLIAGDSGPDTSGSAGPGPGQGSAGPGGARWPAATTPTGTPRHHDEPPPGEVPSDDLPAGGQVSEVAELTGMDLIQRELGGQVIDEIED